MISMVPVAVTAALVLPGVAAAADNDTVSSSHALVRAGLAGHATVAAQMRAHGTETRLRRANLRLARRVARLEGDELRRGHRARIAGLRAAQLRKRNAALRDRVAELRRRERAEAQAAAATPPHLAAIAACESGGNPAAIGGGGLYRGKYQFSIETWHSVGGTGDPAAASEAEQDQRAALLYARAGSAPWPVCG